MKSDIFLAGNVRIVIFFIFWVMYRTVGSELRVAHVLEDPTASILWVEVRSSVCLKCWSPPTYLCCDSTHRQPPVVWVPCALYLGVQRPVLEDDQD